MNHEQQISWNAKLPMQTSPDVTWKSPSSSRKAVVLTVESDFNSVANRIDFSRFRDKPSPADIGSKLYSFFCNCPRQAAFHSPMHQPKHSSLVAQLPDFEDFAMLCALLCAYSTSSSRNLFRRCWVPHSPAASCKEKPCRTSWPPYLRNVKTNLLHSLL